MDALDISNYTAHFTAAHVRQWKDAGVGLAIVQLITGVNLTGDDCATQIRTCLDGGVAVDCYLFPGNDGLGLSTAQRLALVPAEARVKIRQLWVDVEPSSTNPSQSAINLAHSVCDSWAPWQTTGDYCLTPEARVLTMNLEWVHAGELREGDEILGFDEEPGMDSRVSITGRNRARAYKPAIVTGAVRREADVFEVVLADGTVMHATGEHRWLTGRYGSTGTFVKPLLWAKTEDIAAGRSIRDAQGRARSLRNVTLARFAQPWKAGTDYAAGFLAAAFDGEGTLHFSASRRAIPRVEFAQKVNPMLTAVRRYLDQYGYSFEEGHVNPTSGVVSFRLTGGLAGALRFLGEMRPPRLMKNWQLASAEGVPFEMRATSHVPVESVRFVGKREIAAISSSSGTYLSEGFGSHNTALWVASKMGWLPWPYPNRKQWLVSVLNSGAPNLGGTFAGTNNHVMSQYRMDVVLAGVSGMDRSVLAASEAEAVTRWTGGPMAITVGEGMANQMAAAGDEPLCDHVNYEQQDSDGKVYQVERCQGTKGVYISSNSSGSWKNIGPV